MLAISIALIIVLATLIWGKTFRNGRYFAVIAAAIAIRVIVIAADEELRFFGFGAIDEYVPYFLSFNTEYDLTDLFPWIFETRVPFYTQLYPGFIYSLLGQDSLWVIRIANACVFTFSLWPIIVIYQTLLKRKPPQSMLLVVVLWPTLIRYSIELGRSSPTVFFVLAAIASLVVITSSPRARSRPTIWFVCLVVSYAAIMIRPPHVAYLMPIIAFFVWRKLVILQRNAGHRFFAGLVAVSLLTVMLGTAIYIYNNIAMPGQVADMEVIADRAESDERGATSYLGGIAPRTPVDFIWYAPLHGFFFMFSPFLWQALAATNPLAFGSMIQAMLIFYWFVNLWRKRKKFAVELRVLRPLIYVLVFAACAMGSGVKNAGSAERWRLPLTVVSIIIVFGTNLGPQRKPNFYAAQLPNQDRRRSLWRQ